MLRELTRSECLQVSGGDNPTASQAAALCHAQGQNLTSYSSTTSGNGGVSLGVHGGLTDEGANGGADGGFRSSTSFTCGGQYDSPKPDNDDESSSKTG